VIYFERTEDIPPFLIQKPQFRNLATQMKLLPYDFLMPNRAFQFCGFKIRPVKSGFDQENQNQKATSRLNAFHLGDKKNLDRQSLG
jgi:hypothetical protein